jgi:beta-galactosidase
VEVYGLTWVPGRRGFEPWQNFFGPDLTRAASRGKHWWHAERPGGPLWLQPQVLGREKEDGRVMEPQDIRLLTMTSLAAGARGVMNLRYRPLLDGPLFGAFGSYGMDGSRTPRSDMASGLARWANAPEQKGLFAATPVRGDIGLLVVPEAQAWDYLLNHDHRPETYREAMWGAYRGFFDSNVQADWVHIDDLENHDFIYAPYPIMLTAEHARALAQWVEAGGILVSEATPGYFGDRGKVGTRQPNNGLDALFGAEEDEVEFMPDIADRIRFSLSGRTVKGGGFLQSYRPTTGSTVGHFEDGRIAVVEHRRERGRTLLVGTHPGVGYFRAGDDDGQAYFAGLLRWAGRVPKVISSNGEVKARLHEGEDGRFLWLVNSARTDQPVRVEISGSPVRSAVALWPAGEGADAPSVRFEEATGVLHAVVGARDALILRVE